ncbi:MAG: response regulator [Planctomycetota bacterium]|nr:response regulator [Planctomycetota bacterium]
MEKDVLSPQRILIADADKVWLGICARTLTAEGYLVRTTEDGEHAHRQILSESFDLIIACNSLPHSSGFELLKRVRTATLIKNTPFILTCVDDNGELHSKAVEAGADDYLLKPVEPQMMKLRVNTILSRTKRMDALGEATYIGRFLPKHFSDILQLVNTTKRNGLMRVVRGPTLTQLWFKNGEVKFARDDSVEGAQAIFNLVRATNGRFEFIDCEPLEKENINKPQMFLLLEFSRKLDTYNASRKVNLKREFAAEADRLEKLVNAGADKVLGEVVENCRYLVTEGQEALNTEDDVERAEAARVKLHETIEWMTVRESSVSSSNTAARPCARNAKGY